MKQDKYFICKLCGNIATKIQDSGVAMVCCGQEMTELTANTVEASAEKHLPVAEVNGSTVTVKVGSVAHPMVAEHWIQWVVLKTNQGVHRKHLDPGMEPTVEFALANGEEAVEVLEYCNLHGLWKTIL